jgi:hypothetical protein
MTPDLPFSKPGTFWRGNLHSHSTCSDGTKSPEDVCKFYQAMGYHFVSITDHFLEQYHYPMTDTRPFRSANFTTIIGAELHAGQTSAGEIWHLLANGLPFDFQPPHKDESGPELAARAMAAGAFVSCAHPAWYALSEEDVLALGDVHAIETINGISHDHNDRIDSWYMLDVMLNRGRRYYGLATDDAHFHVKHNDRLLGWVWVKSETLDDAAILAALKRGDYYSSTGPVLEDVQISGDTMYVKCSPVNNIFVTGRGSKSAYLHGNGLMEAEINTQHLKSPFVRLTVRDSKGGRAWTNPVWLMK